MSLPDAILQIVRELESPIMIVSIGWVLSRIISAWKIGNILKR